MDAVEIKRFTSMNDILARYGLRTDRNGFICCPFHTEKTASMKIYPDSFYCFGCGANGDIFSFVQKMEGISFKDAFKSLGGTYPEHEKSGQKKQTFLDVRHRIRDQKAAALKRQRDVDTELAHKRAELRDLSFWCRIYAMGMEAFEPMSDEWCFCANRIEVAFSRHEILLSEIWQEVKRRGG